MSSLTERNEAFAVIQQTWPSGRFLQWPRSAAAREWSAAHPANSCTNNKRAFESAPTLLLRETLLNFAPSLTPEPPKPNGLEVLSLYGRNETRTVVLSRNSQ